MRRQGKVLKSMLTGSISILRSANDHVNHEFPPRCMNRAESRWQRNALEWKQASSIPRAFRPTAFRMVPFSIIAVPSSDTFVRKTDDSYGIVVDARLHGLEP